MDIKDTLIKNKPREKAGARSASRFDYQEDLMIMDSESTPQKVSFYQIKGKQNKAHWTLGELLKSPKSTKGDVLLSIIGKLYDCKIKAEKNTESMNFVSNIGFKVGDKYFNSLDKKEVCVIELNDIDKKKINEKLNLEHPSEDICEYEDITFLKVTELNLNDSPTYTKGKIADFLNDSYPKTKHNIPLIYQHLFNEVKRKSNYNKDVISYDDLVKCKAIGKSTFQNMLDICGASKDFDSAWKNIEAILSNEGVKYSRIKKYKNAWDKVEIERMEPNNSILTSIIKNIKELITHYVDNDLLDNDTLLECVSKILSSYNQEPINQTIYDEIFIEALTLSELYD